MTDLKVLLANLHKKNRCSSEYYRALDIWDSLKNVNKLDIINDVLLTPFYLTSNSVFEIYDYELNISNVKQSAKESFLLRKTGKKSLEDIDIDILQKLDLCYVEVINEDTNAALAQIKKYFNYIFNSPNVKKRVPGELGTFEFKNLYFEVFF